jgi:MscS family membrane protein
VIPFAALILAQGAAIGEASCDSRGNDLPVRLADSAVKGQRKLFHCIAAMALSLVAREGFAQAPQPAPASPQPAPAKPQPQDPLGRNTPRGCVLGFLKAAGRADFSEAAEFLDVRASPAQAREFARQLGMVLDQGLSVNLDALSRSPEGDLTDGLRPTRERIGTVRTRSGELDILLDRVTRANQEPIWLFSAETVRGVPRAFDELQAGSVERFLPQVLTDVKLLSIPLWRWLSLIVFIGFALIAGTVVTHVLRPLLSLLGRGGAAEAANRHLRSLAQPIRLLLLALVSFYLSRWGVTVLGRAIWANVSLLLVVAGVSWFLIIFSDIASDLRSQKMIRIQATNQLAVLALVRRLLKIFVLFIAVVFLLRRAGVDVSALLAGLGIGGIALALGAQKTLEDLLGGVTIISRKAVRVGDFCQLAGAIGTIEDIGLSSTRIRTPDRTVVSMPNAKISQMNLENYSMRDKIWFHHVFGLRYDTSPQTLRSVLDQVNRMLREHPRVERETARLRFVAFGPSSLNLEIYAYIQQTDFAEFLVIQEELMLRIMDIVAANGTALALPAQVTYFDRDTLNTGDKRAAIENSGDQAIKGQAVPGSRTAETG